MRLDRPLHNSSKRPLLLRPCLYISKTVHHQLTVRIGDPYESSVNDLCVLDGELANPVLSSKL